MPLQYIDVSKGHGALAARQPPAHQFGGTMAFAWKVPDFLDRNEVTALSTNDCAVPINKIGLQLSRAIFVCHGKSSRQS